MKISLTSLLCFSLICGGLSAAPPGTLLDGDVTAMQRDGSGMVWAVRDHGLALLEDHKWVAQRIEGLKDGVQCVTLSALPNGDLACLWLAPGSESWNVTRHRAKTSQVWASFKASFHSGEASSPDRVPEIFGLTDGSILITEGGPLVVMIPQDGKVSGLLQIPEGFFTPPKLSPGSENRRYVRLRAVEDRSHGIWLWSQQSAAMTDDWRLSGLVHLKAGEKSFSVVPFKEKEPIISEVAVWDERRLAVCLAGQGLFYLPLDAQSAADSLQKQAEPEPGAFDYIEKLFFGGGFWHAVSTVRPSLVEGGSDRGLGMVLKFTEFYDTTKPVDALWRLEGSRWTALIRGLDRRPIFGINVERPWVKTALGLIVGSSDGAPWWIPDSSPDHPCRLASEVAFPVGGSTALCPAPDGGLVCVGAWAQGHASMLWPFQTPLREEGSPRLESILTEGVPLQDSRGRIWCIRADHKLMRWDGRQWSERPLPDNVVDGTMIRFVPDDRDQAWLLPVENHHRTAILDLRTEKWRVFPSLSEALEAQLPRGVRLSVPESPLYEPCFGKDGRIGVVTGGIVGDAEVMLHEDKQWRIWKAQEILGESAWVTGAPFFDDKGGFNLPVYGDETWQWRRDKGWAQREHEEDPRGVKLREFRQAGGTRNEMPGVADRFGVIWSVDEQRQLKKRLAGQRVVVLGEDDPNPFVRRHDLQRVLVDDCGNALLDTEKMNGPHENILIRACLPVPQVEVASEETRDASVRLRVHNKAGGETCYSWSLDGGPWSAVQKEEEMVISPVSEGAHRVAVRAYNAELAAGSEPAIVEVKVRLDTHRLLEQFMAQLAGENWDRREQAARDLVNLGPSILPQLKGAREKAPTSSAQWWLDAVIQQIERQGANAPDGKKEL